MKLYIADLSRAAVRIFHPDFHSRIRFTLRTSLDDGPLFTPVFGVSSSPSKRQVDPANRCAWQAKERESIMIGSQKGVLRVLSHNFMINLS